MELWAAGVILLALLAGILALILCRKKLHLGVWITGVCVLGMLFMARGENEDAKEYFNEYLGFDIPLEEKEKIQKIIDRLG